MGKYNKLVVAVVGVLAIVGRDYLGLEFDDAFSAKIADVVIGTLTLIGVEQIPNKQ